MWILAALALLPGCTTKQNINEIVVGEVDSMSGNEATFGIDTQRGIMMAFDETNAQGGIRGKKLRLITMDTQGQPDEAARAIAKIMTNPSAVAIITGATSSGALAMAPFAEQYGVPLISSAATNPRLTMMGESIFRVCFTDPFQGEVLARFTATNLNLKRVAILRDLKSDYSIGLADVFTREFEKLGGTITLDQSYAAGDIDFKSQLTSIRSTKPEAIFIPGYYTDVSLIARQSRHLGLDIPLLGGDGWDSPKLREIGGSSLIGSYFSNFYALDDASPRVQAFRKNYKEHFKSDPDGSTAMGYEAANFLIDALKIADTKETLKKALASEKPHETLSGMMRLDANRNAQKSVVILKIGPDGTPTHFTTIHPKK